MVFIFLNLILSKFNRRYTFLMPLFSNIQTFLFVSTCASSFLMSSTKSLSNYFSIPKDIGCFKAKQRKTGMEATQFFQNPKFSSIYLIQANVKILKCLMLLAIINLCQTLKVHSKKHGESLKERNAGKPILLHIDFSQILVS